MEPGNTVSESEIIVGSPEWTRRLTCSRFPDLMLGPGSWPRLKRDMINPPKPFTSAPTDHGNENEPRAVALYEIETGYTCVRAKFRTLAGDDRIGGTADRLILGHKAAIEVKCPFTKSPHLLAGQGIISEGYRWQCVGYQMVYELDWLDFVSFDPSEPVESSLFVIRLHRDDTAIAKLREACSKFWDWFDKAEDERPVHDFLVPGASGVPKLF